MDLEEAEEEEAVGDGVKVFVAAEEREDLGQVGLRKPVSVPNAGWLFLTSAVFPVFEQNVLGAVPL